jgi:hypothetical protein
MAPGKQSSPWKVHGPSGIAGFLSFDGWSGLQDVTKRRDALGPRLCIRASGRGGQPEGDAPARAGIGPDLAAMRLDHATGDRQAEAGASGVAVA